MRGLKILGLLAILHALSACTTYSLQELRSTTPKGNEFQSALSNHYLKFAEEKAADYNWAHSSYFADKGLKAAYGNDVGPEELALWNLPADKAPQLAEAREKLMAALAAKAGEKPKVAAAAQFYFDCWVEQQSNDWRTDEIAYCRDGYESAMVALIAEPLPPEPQPEPQVAPPEEPAPEPQPEPQLEPQPEPQAEAPPEEPKPAEPPQKQSYIVFFGTNRTTLDLNGEQMVGAVADDVKKWGKDYTIVVNGHTDAAGSKRYNMELSKKRAQQVLDELVKRGIPEATIQAFGFGETDLKVPTKDGKSESKNRRVEIFIGDE